ncbi:hypothetical protein EKO23_10955 [Nocardioides guangzhouensis]|uniref:Septum formation-related domain-containing protein n=1 Tax=Nocardioides guangzhouensis TaxID=2497878 RepID=A0A4Q4ZCU5_9ACTN|nr:septum formation family protein [Nocardioides guangzhouensis]RYP85827.1 hypothetical protein EKO23_10955 [Nocardioides guangzhouensis]
MTVHHRHLRTTMAALAAGLLVLVSGCSEETGAGDAAMGAPASSTASPTPDPLAGAPTVDACYKMTYARSQAATNGSAPVNCYDDHTTITYYVGTFPDDAAASDPVQVRKDCTAHLAEGLGLSKKELRSSVFSWIWFEPTTSQWSAGARWFRCDAKAETGGRLKLLPAGSSPILTDGVPDAYFRCVDNRNDQGRYVTCDQKHDYRWAGYFQARGGASYPSRKAFEKQGKGCYEFTDNGAYWVTWPLEPGWDNGDREMNCYKLTAG